MAKTYIVKEGECLHSIAAQEGFFWETIWNESHNAELKNKRKDPAVLFAGDEVYIPDRRVKNEAVASGKVYRFRIKGIPVKLRLVVQHNEQVIANEEYTLVVNGRTTKGKTNAEGLVEEFVDPGATTGRLTIRDLVIDLQLGAMDPVEEDVGVQARLQNLGLYDGLLDGDIGPKSKAALAEFQAAAGIEPTGDLDDTTRAELLGRHRDVGPAAQSPPPGADADTAEAADAGGAETGNDDGDPTDENQEFPEYSLEHVADASD